MPPSRRLALSPRARRLLIRLASAFLFFVLLDLISPRLRLDRIVDALGKVSASIQYAGRSLSVGTGMELVRARLSFDRYHRAVLNVSAPFNLSEACREPIAGRYGLNVARLCKSSWVQQRNWVFDQPAESRNVDPLRYPRRWYERILGMPDAALHAAGCAWKGRDVCLPPAPYTAPPGNWFGRLVIVSVFLWAVAMATFVDWTKPGDPPRIVVFLISAGVGLFYASIAMMIVGSLVALFLKIGVWIAAAAGTALTGAAAKPFVWAVAAVKDIAADQAKDVIGRGLNTGTGSASGFGGGV